jgi:miniconductance mechanosensitive channel
MEILELITEAEGMSALAAWFGAHTVLGPVVALGALAALAWFALAVSRRYLLRLGGAVARRTPFWQDDVLLGETLLRRVAWLAPLILLHLGIPFVPHLPDNLSGLLQRLALSTLLLIAVRIFAALLSAVQEIYNRRASSKSRPIKGVLQVINIVAHLLTVIFIVATLMKSSPWVLFSGLGAMTAILLLVFRDTLLSLVAGIQLTANDLIRVGDWIEMPQFNADGDVIDIALNSVRVQNWDRTITVIPTHKFLENSFKNWRGMRDAGGRRIKRSLQIDMRAVRFLTDEEIERFGRFALLRDYIAGKRQELQEHNSKFAAEPDTIANARRLTNIGTLRAYAINYLRQHPGVHQGMTLMVRQLQPTAEGLPLEIYTFTNDTAWAVYEGIQGDIFDHLLAILPEFGLRVFQSPSGHDLSGALEARWLHPSAAGFGAEMDSDGGAVGEAVARPRVRTEVAAGGDRAR